MLEDCWLETEKNMYLTILYLPFPIRHHFACSSYSRYTNPKYCYSAWISRSEKKEEKIDMSVEYRYCAPLNGQKVLKNTQKLLLVSYSQQLYNTLFPKYTTYDTTLCFNFIWVSILVQDIAPTTIKVGWSTGLPIRPGQYDILLIRRQVYIEF